MQASKTIELDYKLELELLIWRKGDDYIHRKHIG